MKKNNVKRSGFTLVELLIVIVVIGVLSTMMMLSSTEAVTSAKASNIVSNLRNLKTAALSLYVSSLDQLGTTKPTIGNVARYMSNETLNSDYNIAFKGVSNNNNYEAASWYITCKVDDSGVKGKLATRAASVGLLGSTGNETAPSDETKNYSNEAYVCIKVR